MLPVEVGVCIFDAGFFYLAAKVILSSAIGFMVSLGSWVISLANSGFFASIVGGERVPFWLRPKRHQKPAEVYFRCFLLLARVNEIRIYLGFRHAHKGFVAGC